MTLPSMFRCTARSDFIGPAAKEAQSIERLIAACKQADRAPIKLLIIGPPGTGKSSLASFFVQCVGADRWSTVKLNGVQARIEELEEIAKSIHYTNLFGEYSVVQLEEIDAMPRVAQIRALTLFDDLPRGRAIVATSNCAIGDLESRFQSRFQVIQLKPPTADEITAFLSGRWKITTQVAKQIAVLASGNVRQALLDAQSYLCA